MIVPSANVLKSRHRHSSSSDPSLLDPHVELVLGRLLGLVQHRLVLPFRPQRRALPLRGLDAPKSAPWLQPRILILGEGCKGYEAHLVLVLLGVLHEVMGSVDGVVCEPAGLLLLVVGRLGHHFGGVG